MPTNWTRARHAAARERCERATAGPWRWRGFDGHPQLEGEVYAAEMNPVLVARGCGNNRKTDPGVEGCMPEKLRDDLRACPPHPSWQDRDLIAHARTDLPDLLAEVDRLRAALERSTRALGGLLSGDMKWSDAVSEHAIAAAALEETT